MIRGYKPYLVILDELADKEANYRNYYTLKASIKSTIKEDKPWIKFVKPRKYK